MKGQVSGLMKLILIAVSLIILIMVGWQLKEFAQEATQEGSCAWSFVAARLTSGDVPAGCKSKIIEINDEVLAKYKVEAQKAISSYTAQGNLQLHTRFTSTFVGPKAVTYWAINALVSDELVSCVQKSRGSGKAFMDVYGASGKTVCVSCAEFSISDKIKSELGGDAMLIDKSFLENRFYQEGRDYVSGWQLIDSGITVESQRSVTYLLPYKHSAAVFVSRVLPATAATSRVPETFLRLDSTDLVLTGGAQAGSGERYNCEVLIG